MFRHEFRSIAILGVGVSVLWALNTKPAQTMAGTTNSIAKATFGQSITDNRSKEDFYNVSSTDATVGYSQGQGGRSERNGMPTGTAGLLWAGLILTLTIMVILLVLLLGIRRRLLSCVSALKSASIHDLSRRMQTLVDNGTNSLLRQMERSHESILIELKGLAEAIRALPQETTHSLIDKLEDQDRKKSLEEKERKRSCIKHKFAHRFKELRSQPNLALCSAIADLNEKGSFDMSGFSSYLRLGEKWNDLLIEWHKLGQEGEVSKIEYLLDEQYWKREIEEIDKELYRLPEHPPVNSFILLLDQIWQDPSLQAERGNLMELLQLEEVESPPDTLIDEASLKDYEIVTADGMGKHLYVKAVVSPGYRRRDNKAYVRKPKVKVIAK